MLPTIYGCHQQTFCKTCQADTSLILAVTSQRRQHASTQMLKVLRNPANSEVASSMTTHIFMHAVLTRPACWVRIE